MNTTNRAEKGPGGLNPSQRNIDNRRAGNGRGGLPQGEQTNWLSDVKGTALKTHIQVALPRLNTFIFIFRNIIYIYYT